ncbi:uncharacterized protein LOC107791310 [Nicotiana tabacum]|uniref:Uncharacterized protein LOC107791310 n=1 Tax=Nicotiana tabacum TaxID=4097 RepID=A0AC58RZM4_TOBAC
METSSLATVLEKKKGYWVGFTFPPYFPSFNFFAPCFHKRETKRLKQEQKEKVKVLIQIQKTKSLNLIQALKDLPPTLKLPPQEGLRENPRDLFSPKRPAIPRESLLRHLQVEANLSLISFILGPGSKLLLGLLEEPAASENIWRFNIQWIMEIKVGWVSEDPQMSIVAE